MSKLAALRAQGFDLSQVIPFEARWHVKCSACEAVVINGIPCHERGCPHIPREEEEEG